MQLRSHFKDKRVFLTKVHESINRPDTGTLAEQLAAAWHSTIKGKSFSGEVDTRHMSMASGDSLLMNIGNGSGSGFLGEVLMIEPDGFLVVAQNRTEDRSRLALHQMETGEDEDPYKGVTYFYAYKDYVLFLDCGVRYQTVAQYISWMLSQALGVTSNMYIKLTPEIEITGDKAKLVKATSLELEPAPYSPKTPVEGYIEKTTGKSVSSESSVGQKILELFRIDYRSLQEYRENAPSEDVGDIEVKVSLKVRRKNRLVPISKALPIGDIIEENPTTKFKLSGKGGQTVGQLIRASYPVQVAFKGSIVDADAVSEIFRGAMNDFVDRGCIVP